MAATGETMRFRPLDPLKWDVEDMYLNYDPEFPQERFRAAGLEAALRSATGRLPSPVPWPDGAAPKAAPLSEPPLETDPLTRFRGYDAVVVTWTAAEATALAALFTPDFLPARWYEYRHDVASYLPLVTGHRAPFNDPAPDMARYHHSLGLYFPCTIGKARVLLFKSGLHLAYDGPHTPVKKLMQEIARAVLPKVFITTGTGGGIGRQVALGDVVIASQTRFDCTTQFKAEPWAKATYHTSALPNGTLAAMTPELLRVNAARVEGGRKLPKIWAGASDTVVTTDFFAFDDSTDHFGLQQLGQACDMGDAMVGQALAELKGVDWYSIRNASDPQIDNPGRDIRAAEHEAGTIYSKYGEFTTAASAIASWAVIQAAFDL
jgi:nucleoside phosphorylase